MTHAKRCASIWDMHTSMLLECINFTPKNKGRAAIFTRNVIFIKSSTRKMRKFLQVIRSRKQVPTTQPDIVKVSGEDLLYNEEHIYMPPLPFDDKRDDESED